MLCTSLRELGGEGRSNVHPRVHGSYERMYRGMPAGFTTMSRSAKLPHTVQMARLSQRKKTARKDGLESIERTMSGRHRGDVNFAFRRELHGTALTERCAE